MVKKKVVKDKKKEEVKNAPPINEAKALKLIQGICPEAVGDTLQNALVNLLTEHNRVKIALEKAPVASQSTDNEDVQSGIKRIEASLKQLKEQFSTMRQFGVGMNKGV